MNIPQVLPGLSNHRIRSWIAALSRSILIRWVALLLILDLHTLLRTFPLDCLVDSNGTKQHAIETYLAKASLSDDLSKFLWAVEVAHRM